MMMVRGSTELEHRSGCCDRTVVQSQQQATCNPKDVKSSSPLGSFCPVVCKKMTGAPITYIRGHRMLSSTSKDSGERRKESSSPLLFQFSLAPILCLRSFFRTSFLMDTAPTSKLLYVTCPAEGLGTLTEVVLHRMEQETRTKQWSCSREGKAGYSTHAMITNSVGQHMVHLYK